MRDHVQIARLAFDGRPMAAQRDPIPEALIVQLQCGQVAVRNQRPAKIPAAMP